MSVISDSILSHTAIVDEEITKPISNSKKTYVTGSRSDISVPMREIACSPTQTKKGLEENTSITVYDTSGPYTDPNATKKDWKKILQLRYMTLQGHIQIQMQPLIYAKD